MPNFLKKIIIWLKKFWWPVALAIFLILGASIYAQQLKTQKQAEIEHYDLYTFAAKDLVSTLSLSGIVDAKRKVKLFYPAGGKLTSVKVKKGDFVAAGDVLTVVDQADLQKRLDQSLNNYMVDRLQFDDFQDQFKTRAATEDENLTSQIEQLLLNNNVLSVEINSIAINNTRLTSPIAGVITDMPDLVAPMNILATDSITVVDPTSLIFRALVDEIDLNLLHEGQTAVLSFDALPDAQVQATINSIALTSTTNASGTAFEVEFLLPEFDLTQLRLGMNGDADVILAQKTLVGVIPVEALYLKDGQNYVRVLSANNQIVEKPITIGLETDDEVEVLSGLEFGEQIITNFE